jgi:ATP-dependent Clp protease ATP-binding subunit ClpA
MFERFTNRARHAVVLAQEEARTLQHNYIGTEHVLLGLLGEPEGIAGQALERFGMTLTSVRTQVEAKVGRGKHPVAGHIPFTPRAKKCLELALREALALHHNYIGTEHLLLGIIREGDGVGAQVLAEQGGDLLVVRQAVLDLVPTASPTESRRWLRRLRANPLGEPSEPEELRITNAADSSLDEAARLAGPHPVGSHHLLLAALSDPNTAAARALSSFGIDIEQAREALRNIDVAGTSDEQPEDAGRRQMTIRVTDDRLIIEATDATLLDLARTVISAVGDRAEEPGTIRGDLPISVSLANVWRATEASLQDIRRRATLPTAPAPATDPDGTDSSEAAADESTDG